MHSPVGLEADFYAFLHRTTSQLRSAREPEKVLRHYLRACVSFFGAEAGCVASVESGGMGVTVLHSQPAEADWDFEFLASLIAERRPDFPRGFICSTLTRRGRIWGVLALRREGRFERWQERSLGPVSSEISDLLERIDHERLAEVRMRIDGKIMRELAPKDLYYQILDGLHQLTRYDHSARLYILEPGSGALQLVAEQIAWRKMKSERIGATLERTEEIAPYLAGGLVYGFDRYVSGWREWTPLGATGLADAVEPVHVAHPESEGPMVRSLLMAPLGTPRGAVGLLCLAAVRPSWFGPHESDVLARFAPIVSLVLQRSQAVESLHERMLLVERRSTLAHLARGVAHDINNALGSVAPLVQQMKTEIDEDQFDSRAFRDDLDSIESSIEVCRRIFSGMLRVARGSSRHDGVCDLERAIQTSMDVLRESLVRQGIVIAIEAPDDIPAAKGGQEDIERVLLNLATNAREAMPRGGTLKVTVDPSDDWIHVRIEDTGRGIPDELVRQIDKPFFSTKPEGWGLGLPTCRSIVSEIGGELAIESALERGTRVTVRLKPALVRELAG